MSSQWNVLASELVISQVMEALGKNGITSFVVETSEEAKKKVQELIPQQSEVMTMTSVTLDSTGIADLLNGPEYNSVKRTLGTMNRETQGLEMNKLGAAPQWTVGSVHAVTEDGKIIIASNTGSQLPAYAYGSQHVVWVVGTQKIVNNVDDGMKRIYEYVLPLESERAHKAYGVEGSNVSKLLIINKEVNPGRLTVLFVKEVLGF